MDGEVGARSEPWSGVRTELAEQRAGHGVAEDDRGREVKRAVGCDRRIVEAVEVRLLRGARFVRLPRRTTEHRARLDDLLQKGIGGRSNSKSTPSGIGSRYDPRPSGRGTSGKVSSVNSKPRRAAPSTPMAVEPGRLTGVADVSQQLRHRAATPQHVDLNFDGPRHDRTGEDNRKRAQHLIGSVEHFPHRPRRQRGDDAALRGHSQRPRVGDRRGEAARTVGIDRQFQVTPGRTHPRILAERARGQRRSSSATAATTRTPRSDAAGSSEP